MTPWRLLARLLLITALCLVAVGSRAAPPAAGTVISNTASATFMDSASGLTSRLDSNTVNTRVVPLEAVALTSNQSLTLVPSAAFVLPHTLTNTGNVTTTYVLSAAAIAGGAFTPVNLQVVQDLNGNGRVDASEPVIGPAGLQLDMRASANVLLTGQIPNTATPGQSARVLLTATSAQQGAQASNTDSLSVTGGAAVQVLLSASVSAATPSSPIDWTVLAINNGISAAGPVLLSIDGVASGQYVLRWPIPRNATLSGAPSTTNVRARVVYHVLGAPASSYVTAVPADALVDAVGWAMPDLPANGTLQGQVRVLVNSNALGTIDSTAYSDWSDQGATLLSTSNSVSLPLPARSADIRFYVSNLYVTAATQALSGKPLYVQADAAMCNADATRVETVPIVVRSQLTGDLETYIGTETGPNTGVFRILPNVPTANAAVTVVASGNGVLEVLKNDTVTAVITTCAGQQANASSQVLIDPSGVVYDSRSNQPIPGATVELIDVNGVGNGGKPGELASVLEFDGVTAAPSALVTGTDGSFTFPLVAAGTYRLRVTAPPGFVFPSALPVSLQPAGRILLTPGSYGGNFTVGFGAVQVDVPLDTGGTSGLVVQKTANKSAAEVGDFVDYTVKVSNTLGVPVANVQVRDRLPAGFAYVAGSARLNGAAVADPTGGAGPQLGFAIGRLAANTNASVTYRVRLGAGSLSGDGTNTAQASAGSLVSNTSAVRVRVLGGVFANEAYLAGKVYADCNRNGLQDAGEPGVPGVRLYLEDGTYAVTDGDGKYSLYGLVPRTHVVKVDATTLPAGAQLQVLDNRQAMDPGSRFADLTNSELHRADFALGACSPELRTQIEARRRALANPAEITAAARTLLTATPNVATTDARSLPAAGVLGLPGARSNSATATTPGGTAAGAAAGSTITGAALPSLGAVADTGTRRSTEQGMVAPVPSTEPPADGEVVPEVTLDDLPLEELLPETTAEPGFLGLEDGQKLTTNQIRVRVKGPAAGRFELLVNGDVVPTTRVGKRSVLEQTGVAGWEYIGVPLRTGTNGLELRVMDPFGNVRANRSIQVQVPGELARITVQAPHQPVADAATPVAVEISLADAQGLPIVARTKVTLQAEAGQWQVQDIDPGQPGLQVMVEGGRTRLLLVPPPQPGRTRLTVSAGNLRGTHDVEFMPNLRPMIAAGLVEGVINLRNLNLNSLQPASSGDVFERQIRSFSRSLDGGRGDATARAALFLKGKVLGSSLLTLAYDSDKPADMRLFRDIQPNQFYPVYGDSSARGFDGQSTGRLYVLLQTGTDFVLLGDFNTQSPNQVRQLTQYTRALNGAKTRWTDPTGQLSIEGFASRTSATHLVQEFRGNGTSGPFQLNGMGVAGSEQIKVVTRRRDLLTAVVREEALAPITDYTVEPLSGVLLLRAPVPSVDADLNPVFVRVEYDVQTGGPAHAVQGAEINLKVEQRTTVGAVVLRDDDPANRQQLVGLTLSSRLAEKTVASAEVARTRTDLQGDGRGERVELRHEEGGTQVRVWAARTDTGFYNLGSPRPAGTTEIGAKAAVPLDNANRLLIDVLKSSNATTGAEQAGAELRLEHSLGGNVKIEAGMRHVASNTASSLAAATLPGTSTTSPGVAVPVATSATTASSVASAQPVQYTSARVRVSAPVPGVPAADAYAVAEQAVDGTGGREVAVGGNYALDPQTRLYLRHSLINSLNGTYAFNREISRYSTVAGVNTTVGEGTQVFNEYRVGESVDGRTSQAAVGLRRTVTVRPGLNLTGAAQVLKPVSGPSTDNSTAISLGAEYTAAVDWKASTQVQWQTSTTSHSWLFSGAVVNRLDAEWTLLNRVLYSDQVNSAGGGRNLVTLQSGVAYRPADTNTWNALGRIEYKRDNDSTSVTSPTDGSSWILSTHMNIQPSRGWVIATRYAAKLATDRSLGLRSQSFTQVAGGRLTVDITERWDAGVQLYSLWGDGQRESAVGLEVGYLLARNLWISGGYNLKGFVARDMTPDTSTQRGLYLRLRYKFDETLLESAGEARPAPAAAAVPVAEASR